MQPWFYLSGRIGFGMVTCIVLSFKLLGPTYAISIVLFKFGGKAEVKSPAS